MTLAFGRARSVRPVLHPRLCAGVVAASSTVHLWLALQNQHGAWLSAFMVVLAGVCLPCVYHIWRNSHVAALHRVMACALFMVVLHGMLLVGSGAGGHAHGPGHAVTGIAEDQAWSLLAVIGLELTTALLAATLVARLRRGRQEFVKADEASGSLGS
ncbi:UNVERIFIED_ORG: hypothetical protein ABIB52_004192 [Arthrobacter sp. UYCu721]